MRTSGCGPEGFEEGLSEAIGQARKIFRQVYDAAGMTPGHAESTRSYPAPPPGGGPRFHAHAHGPGPEEDDDPEFGPDADFEAAAEDFGPGFGPGPEHEFGPGPHQHHHGPGHPRAKPDGPWGGGPWGGPWGPGFGSAKDWMGFFGGARGGRRHTRPAPPWGPGHHGGFGGPRRPKASRGDVRATILALLSEGPRTGYQIMSDIEERSGGAWRPSPGAVYPALSQLADEGLIVGEEAGGKRTFTLTDAGREYVAENPEMARGAWESMAQPGPGELPGLFGEAARLGMAIMQTAHAGTPEQLREAERLLEQTRRRLYQVLADDADDSDEADDVDDVDETEDTDPDQSGGPGE